MNILVGFFAVVFGILVILGVLWIIGLYIEHRVKGIDPETYLEEHREKKQRSIWRRDIGNPFND